jgi:hypothetical protein
MYIVLEYEMTIFLSHTNTVDKKGGDKKTDIQKYINKQTITYKSGI